MTIITVSGGKTHRISLHNSFSSQNPGLTLRQLMIALAVNAQSWWYSSTDWLSGPPMTERDRIRCQAGRARRELRVLNTLLAL
jgi:hypothetical protein